MRSALAIISLFALAHLGLAVKWEDIWNGLPNTCRDQCTPVNNLFVDCKRQVGKNTSADDFFDGGKVDVSKGQVEVDLPGLNNDNVDQVEQRYADCVCNAQNARTDIPNCSNCLVQNDSKDKEVTDLARRCNFTTGGAPPNTAASPTSTLVTANAAGSTILSTLGPTATFSPPTGTLTNQTVQATGAASKLGGAQNVLMAAALLGLPAVL